MFCPNCGTRTTDGAPFCANCGSRIMADSAEQQPTGVSSHAGLASGTAFTKQRKMRSAAAASAGSPVGGLQGQSPLTKALLIVILGLLLISFVMTFLNVFTVHSFELRYPAGYSMMSKQASRARTPYSDYNDEYAYRYDEDDDWDDDDYFGSDRRQSELSLETFTVEELNSLAAAGLGFNPKLHVDFSMQEAGGTWLLIAMGVLHMTAVVLVLLALTGTISAFGYLAAGCASGLSLILLVIKWIAGGFGGVLRNLFDQILRISEQASSGNSNDLKEVQQVYESLKVHLTLTLAGWILLIALILVTAAAVTLFLINRKKRTPAAYPTF